MSKKRLSLVAFICILIIIAATLRMSLVKGQGQVISQTNTVIIQPNGEITSPDAALQISTLPITRNGNIYTLTSDWVPKSTGAWGYTIQITYILVDKCSNSLINGNNKIFNSNALGPALVLQDVTNVTVGNLKINGYANGIQLLNSQNCNINQNQIFCHGMGNGIELSSSNSNSVRLNLIVASYGNGLKIVNSESNDVSGNTIILDWGYGLPMKSAILLSNSSSNTFSGNTLFGPYNEGIQFTSSSNNLFFQNSFLKGGDPSIQTYRGQPSIFPDDLGVQAKDAN